METETKLYQSGKKKGLIRPLIGKPIAKNPYKKIYKYILKNIDSSGYDKVTTTPKEKLRFLRDTFHSEYQWHINKHGVFKAFCEWMMGLPSSFTIDFYYHEMIALAKKWGKLPDNATEAQEDRITQRWFPFMAMRTQELMRKNGVTL